MYAHGCKKRLIKAARGGKLHGLEAGSVLKKAKKEKTFQQWEEKALHGQYLRQTKEAKSKKKLSLALKY